MEEMHEVSQLKTMMTKAIKENLEGLVVKSMGSIYEADKRGWFKLKKDYIGMADTVDLVCILFLFLFYLNSFFVFLFSFYKFVYLFLS